MGLFETTSAKPVAVHILVPGFVVHGQLAVIGTLQTYLNDERRGTFSLNSVSVYGLEPGNPARSMQLEGLFVAKTRCHAILFDTMLPQEETGLLPRTERLAVYTSHYCIQGDFHMGPDVLIGEFAFASRAQFLGVTSAQIFPLFPPQAALPQSAPLVFVHRDALHMHHMI